MRTKELKKERNTGGTEVGALRPTESTLPGVCMDVKIKGLPAKGFVSM